MWILVDNQKNLVKTDNMAVVQICSNDYTRDMILSAYVRNLRLITARYDIDLTVSHIDGKNNIFADLLSRWKGSDSNYKVLGQY